MTNGGNSRGPYLAPGTPVRYDGGRIEGDAEYGVIVHCWLNDEMDAYDCYVAFFGNHRPTSKPKEKPYVLRYLSMSLTVLDPKN